MITTIQMKATAILLKGKAKERGGRHWKRRHIFFGNIMLTTGK
ncbi:hypothetical protein ACQUWN_21185 [Rossellomorea aquimaris]|nr:hypothetical protein [Rossellomorea vietnamensis]